MDYFQILRGKKDGLVMEKLMAFFWNDFTVRLMTMMEQMMISVVLIKNSYHGRLPKALRSISAIGADNGK